MLCRAFLTSCWLPSAHFSALAAPNDFDGDGHSDLATYSPKAYEWNFRKSTEGDSTAQLGSYASLPVTGDFDGDGRCDFGIFETTSGVWQIQMSAGGISNSNFGYTGVIPHVDDFDGDGIADKAVYDPNAGTWFFQESSGGFSIVQFGFNDTLPVTGDFDGDGKDDIGCYHPASGDWFFMKSSDGFSTTQFGFEGTLPVTGDYDGDGKDDFGSYFAPLGSWFVVQSTDGTTNAQYFGFQGAYPIGATALTPGSAFTPTPFAPVWEGIDNSGTDIILSFNSDGTMTRRVGINGSYVDQPGVYTRSGDTITGYCPAFGPLPAFHMEATLVQDPTFGPTLYGVYEAGSTVDLFAAGPAIT